MFISMLFFFTISYLLGAINLIVNNEVRYSALITLSLPSVALAAFSQLFMQYFIYNLLFPKHKALKYSLCQLSPILIILFVLWIGGACGLFSKYTQLSDNIPLKELICNPVFILRATIIFIQCVYTIGILLISKKLIPIYQDYIYRTESNDAHNVIWIKELCNLFFGLSITYTLVAFFNNSATIILYLLLTIYFFSRTISLIICNYVPDTNINKGLYAKIGIRWNISTMWSVLKHKKSIHNQEALDRALFTAVDGWIDQNKAYANSNFSYKDLTKEFSDLDYNKLDELLQKFCGSNFQAYIRNKRIEQAIKLMGDDTNNFQLKNIAIEVGFESSSSFSRAFKATKGMTASQWRKA
ncbi:MAG: helix-turn-helix domain-containing protein [Rikenellaceae bacterium]